MPTDAAAADPARIATAFAELLRRFEVPVPVGATVSFALALGELGIESRSATYWAGRATLIHRPEHIPAYDRAFGVLFLQREPVPVDVPPPEPITLAVDDDVDGDGDVTSDDGETVIVRYSPAEVLRHKDFGSYTHGEFDEARKLMADLRLVGSTRRSRRLRRARRRRGRPDIRRTVRRSFRLHGEPISRAFLDQSERPRRLVLLLDVSGSMEPYTRALLRFLHAAVVGRRLVEAFALGTRLTRITRELESHDPDAALAAAGRAVSDWSGGTRLGAVLRTFNDRWGVRGLARGAVVVILSDGWDRGDPAALAEQMERLSRVAYRIVWVNPLKATPGYAPLARGMAAALPYVDDFAEGHSLAALERLAAVINRP